MVVFQTVRHYHAYFGTQAGGLTIAQPLLLCHMEPISNRLVSSAPLTDTVAMAAVTVRDILQTMHFRCEHESGLVLKVAASAQKFIFCDALDLAPAPTTISPIWLRLGTAPGAFQHCIDATTVNRDQLINEFR
jgi:hypothetical protein